LTTCSIVYKFGTTEVALSAAYPLQCIVPLLNLKLFQKNR
jgi:hypothetical protein